MSRAIIHMFPCLSDNYGFLLHDPSSGLTAAIDTPDAEEIKAQCKSQGWTLTHILNTHHHWDHTGGNLELAKVFPALEIIGPAHDAARIPGLTQGMREGETLEFGAQKIDVIETPGHTMGHIIYHLPHAQVAFVGDTLFKMGCGRLFEGTPEEMFASLAKIAALPDETLLYCAHEYTLSNGRFALTIEPDNQALIDEIARAKNLREKGLPTVPTHVALETAINPFMRAKSAQKLGEIRRAKDQF
jgi:hydroxyacylglutathione hydrolase